MFLGINLAIEPYSIALIKNTDILAEISCQGSYDFTEDLILEIENLAKKAHVSLRKVKALAVASGPGSYTGLRIGVVPAKTIAQVFKIPVYGVSTLEAMAYQGKDMESIFFSLIPARKNEMNAAMFSSVDQQLSRLTDDFVWDNEIMLQKLKQFQKTIYLIGLIPPLLEKQILKLKNPNLQIIKKPLAASALAFMAQDNFKNKQEGNYLYTHPRYSHQPNIGKPKKKVITD